MILGKQVMQVVDDAQVRNDEDCDFTMANTSLHPDCRDTLLTVQQQCCQQATQQLLYDNFRYCFAFDCSQN